MVKHPPCKVGDPGLIPGWDDPTCHGAASLRTTATEACKPQRLLTATRESPHAAVKTQCGQIQIKKPTSSAMILLLSVDGDGIIYIRSLFLPSWESICLPGTDNHRAHCFC